MVKTAFKIEIEGSVQGVFFRQFTKENADKLNLKGFVRNLENGNVEVFVEGDKEKLAEFIELIKKGPKYSIIRDVKIEEKKWTGEFKDFKILKI